MTLGVEELIGTDVPMLREAAFLGGDWVYKTEATVAVTNPTDGTTVGSVPRLIPEHVEHAIEAAVQSWSEWRAKRADERADILQCDSQVADALSKGVTLLYEGGVKQIGTLFYFPTVLGDVDESMQIYRDETFGPVAALTPFGNDTEITDVANDTIYGLAAYFYTSNVERAWDVAEALEYGMVALNTSKITGPPIPIGGYKHSGLGREGSRYGLDEFSQLKYFCWGQD